MKKAFCLILSVLMLLSFVGCTEKKEQDKIASTKRIYPIAEEIGFYRSFMKEIYGYSYEAFYEYMDIEGDGIDEMLVRMDNNIYIYTFKKKEKEVKFLGSLDFQITPSLYDIAYRKYPGLVFANYEIGYRYTYLEYITIENGELSREDILEIDNNNEYQTEEDRLIPYSDNKDLVDIAYETYKSGGGLKFKRINTTGLEELRERMADEGKLLGIMNLGYHTDYDGYIESKNNDKYNLEYNFLLTLPKNRFISAGKGNNVFAIIPADGDCEVTVYSAVYDNEYGETKNGRRLYSSKKGEWLAIKGNYSSTTPDFVITVKNKKGDNITYSPLRDKETGHLNLIGTDAEKILDLSDYY